MGRVADLWAMWRRAARKPPRVIARRVWFELRAEAARVAAPWIPRRYAGTRLLSRLGGGSLDEVWARLAARPHAAAVVRADGALAEALGAAARERILARAERALGGEVAFLGARFGAGEDPDWSKDYRSGRRWPNRYFRSIEYANLGEPSDVKIAWELSRMQWLIPAGQAYLLTGEERYAVSVRRRLEGWIAANPYAHSVNWACTMEVALRIIVWSWFFHVFHASRAWADPGFRMRFLQALYLHGFFTARNMEVSDINGNHYTADAAGLAFAGLFFGEGPDAAQWLAEGTAILEREILLQVSADGVQFEASTAYHRLVMELFLWPALYRRRLGMPVSPAYLDRLRSMARFVAAYTRPDGSAPLLGDADDARVLPFGDQPVDDHRYLAALADGTTGARPAAPDDAAVTGELFWALGPAGFETLERKRDAGETPVSVHFAEGGYYVMRTGVDHVFIDCAPIGLGGRGGHGHNDCLSFEAVLAGIRMVSDCGAYLYTADWRERNNFRSTAYHNTPQIDGEEINRFIRPDYLWNMHYDAVPEVRRWEPGEERDLFCGSHAGYQRLASPVRPVRTFVLDRAAHALLVLDRFEGRGEHEVTIPLHLDPGIRIGECEPGRVRLIGRDGQELALHWSDAEQYRLEVEEGRVSPSYGRVLAAPRLLWRRRGALATLRVAMAPEDGAARGLLARADLEHDSA